MNIRKYIGDKQFYKMVLLVALPILVQNGITNFVSFLDNFMVGRLGLEQMSGVGIVNQMVFVFNLCVFGATAGAGIFFVQYFGQKDKNGMRYSFQVKAFMCAILAIGSILLFLFFDDFLIGSFLHEGNENSKGDLVLTLAEAKKYLRIVIVGIIPFAISQIYGGTLREMGQTLIPMICGVIAVVINGVLNYIFIFGAFGMPKLGVVGAGVGTIVARFVECAILVLYTHRNKIKYYFIEGAFTNLKIPRTHFVAILIKSLQLLGNEALWSMGITILSQCYSYRGIEVFSALTITTTVLNMFNIAFVSIGTAISIIVGRYLGRNEFEKALDIDTKLITFSVMVAVFVSIIMYISSRYIPELYETTEEVKALARYMLTVLCIMVPFQAFMHATYFTLRSGGKTLITFLFDSLFVWVICVPLALALTRLTNLSIYYIYPIVQASEFIKVITGSIMLKKKIWLNNITV